MIAERTGLLLNNQMDDFTIPGVLNPPSDFVFMKMANNLISPGRKPLSSMSPLIFTENKKLKLAIGASGGYRILTALLQVLYRHLILGTDLETAINTGRVSYFSDLLYVENIQKGKETLTTPNELVEALEHLVSSSVRSSLMSKGECI